MRGVRTAMAALLAASLAACTADEAPAGREALPFDPAPAGPSWAPAPRTVGGLAAVATVDGDRFVLHTAHGDVTFLPGVNLGSTVPGTQPGEVAATAEDYRRWFPLMRAMGLRVVRIYTILRPAFYTELAAYNEAHPDGPLYLVQGVYPPDESYVERGDLYAPAMTSAFTAELRDAVAAVHGDLRRGPTAGRADGRWTADVSRWLAAWVVGAELDPRATQASDRRNAGRPVHRGRYFAATAAASPTESWLAARMDELATASAARGSAAPVAFVNWPTLDPLRHPEEPLEQEDLVGLDANHVLPTRLWPAGTFASYHAYPYYPDFQRHEPGLHTTRYAGRIDPYAGYLAALKRHHAGMPVMVTEFGVPSSLGSAHAGPLGRDQGGHTEQQAMRTDAELLRLIASLGLAGGLVFEWTDEWFKVTWNTQRRHVPADRRQLWHDPLTNEQYFGLLATDPVGGPDARPRTVHDGGGLRVDASSDESWVHLRITLPAAPDAPVAIGFDVVPGGAERLPGSRRRDGTSDFAVVVDPATGRGQAWVRQELDPVPLDYLPPAGSRPAPVDGWQRQQLTTNRPLVIPSTGRRLPMEFFDVGRLRRGEMDPARPGYDSRATWRLDGAVLTLRVPWGLLGMADPSARRALVPRPDRTVETVPVERIGLVVEHSGRRTPAGSVTWSPWDRVHARERVKAGVAAWIDAVTAVSR